MSEHLMRKESPGRALRRVCQNHAGRALASLQKKKVPQAVHDVRREIKMMRALFRLTCGALRGKEHRKTARVMRLAAKPLAASRDARVTRWTFENLVKSKVRDFPNLRARLQTHASRAERQLKDFDSGAVAKFILKQVCHQLEDLGLKRLGWPDIRAGLEQSHARGRSAYELAKLKPSPENLHEWRKRVKDLWYQMDFLCPDWPSKTRALLGSLKKLGGELGRDHDLVLLGRFSQEQCGPSSETARLQELIEARRKQCGAGIRQLGSRLYANEPKVVCDQVEKDWKAWRSAKK
ncbi:MAG: CHAD domain-containing protein [Verrucomicrobiota bacterium]|jgi:CHAD domain-containing protein